MPDDAPPDAGTTELVVTPDPGRAVTWAGLSLVLVALTLVLALPSDGGTVEWIAVGIAVAVAVFFVVPVVAPHLTTVVLDERGVTGRSYHHVVEVPWEVVQVARIVRVAGEEVLELHVRAASVSGDPWRTVPVGVLLPIGTDVAMVERFLEHRPGRRARR